MRRELILRDLGVRGQRGTDSVLAGGVLEDVRNIVLTPEESAEGCFAVGVRNVMMDPQQRRSGADRRRGGICVV